jgi:hypothetical protein
MTIQNGDILRVAARMNIQGRGDIVNVFHMRLDSASPWAESTLGAGVGDFLEELYANINTYIVNEQAYEDINVFNVTQGVPVGVFAWPTMTTGGDTSQDALPSQVSALVRFTTGYSRNWARKFLGTFTEISNESTGRVAGGLLSALALFAADALTGYVIGGTDQLIMVVFNKALDAYVELEEAVIRNVWSTIRTRREGVGS